MSRGSQVLSALFGAHWAMDEAKFHAMLAFLDEREGGLRFSAEEIRARVGEPTQRTTVPQGSGVAVLPVFGLISHRAHMVQDISGPGGTSTELLGRDFDTAMQDPKVGTIVLDVSSPGGNVYGVQELADKIYAARGKKPVIAVSNALAASAAYWIASAAEELVVSPSGEVGSIGVFAVHTDTSRRDANAGVQRTVLKAGRYKAEGVYAPLTQDAATYAQEQLNEYLQAFGGAVARNRRVSLETALGPDFGEGRTVTAKMAVARKMADRVATLEQVLQELGISSDATGKPMKGSRKAVAVADEAIEVQVSAEELMPSALMQIEQSNTTTMASAIPVHYVLPDARQGATPEPDEPLATTAPQAKEQPVSTPITPAPGSPGASDANTQMRASLDRSTRIQELCTLAGASMQQFNDFLASDLSPEQVRAQLQTGRARPQPVAITGMVDREADRGFSSIGEQLVAIVQAGKPGGRRDARLMAINAAASGMNEGIGSEGGFFIAPELLPGVLTPIYQQDPLLARVKRIPIGAGKNGVRYNVVDETSRANGSRYGGVQAYWAAEADTATAKKPKLRQMALDLKKIIGIGYLTEELTEDAPAAGMLLTDAFRDEVRFMVGAAVFAGTGGGQPLGFLNSGAVALQAIEATQTIANTNTFIATNTSKMLSRMPAEFWGEAVWLFNPELLPLLVTATIGSSAVPIFVAGAGMQGAPPATIWGRPAFPSDFCEAVGTPGDLALVAPSQYHLGVRDENARVADSVHVRFLYDENTLKITHRVDGAPVWTSAVTPYKGAATRSPFISLAVRS